MTPTIALADVKQTFFTCICRRRRKEALTVPEFRISLLTSAATGANPREPVVYNTVYIHPGVVTVLKHTLHTAALWVRKPESVCVLATIELLQNDLAGVHPPEARQVKIARITGHVHPLQNTSRQAYHSESHR